ncbi:MAG: sugar nucleotide-binding protein [Gammaproteobacteria bacterium]|nr:sugar nucleotide-binding protein [Gammaproteobacteria bacterium]
MATVLIAGCGDVGTALGLRRAAGGDRVLGLRRRARTLPEPIVPVSADLADPASLAALPDAPQLLVYIAAADGFDDAAYERAYVTGPDNLLRHLEASGSARCLRRVVLVSSTSVYAQANGEWVDEESETRPQGFSGTRLLEGEALVRARCREIGATPVVVRFGGIYGPGRNRLLSSVRDGRPCSETPPLYTNRIHRDDCVGVIDHLLGLPEPEALYLGVDCEPAPQCVVMDYIARLLRCPPVPRLEPHRADEATSVRSRRAGSKRCNNRRLLASGYRFVYPSYRTGYAALIDDTAIDDTGQTYTGQTATSRPEPEHVQAARSQRGPASDRKPNHGTSEGE